MYLYMYIYMSDTLHKYECSNRDQIHSTVCNCLSGIPRGSFSRNTYRKVLAMVEVY